MSQHIHESTGIIDPVPIRPIKGFVCEPSESSASASEASLLHPVIPPPACETPIEGFSMNSGICRHHTTNYSNELEAQKLASQDDLTKKSERRQSERSCFNKMSPQIYKRRCSLSTEISPENIGLGYSGENTPSGTPSNTPGIKVSAPTPKEVPSSHYSSVSDSTTSFKLDTPDDTDTGNESSVSATYSNVIAGQQGGHNLHHHANGLKEQVNQLRKRIDAVNEKFNFKEQINHLSHEDENESPGSEDSEEETSEADDENIVKGNEVKEHLKKLKKKNKKKHRPSFSFNDYRASMLRKSLSHDNHNPKKV